MDKVQTDLQSEQRVPLQAVWLSFFIFIVIAFILIFFGKGQERWGYLFSLFPLRQVGSDVIIGVVVGTFMTLVTVVLYKMTNTTFPKNDKTELIVNIMKQRFGVTTIAWGAGISEEFLFRAAMMGLLMDWIGSIWACVITAFIFMALHIPQYKGRAMMHVVVLGMGLVLGGLFLWTEALWAPIFAHAIYNGFVSLMIKAEIIK